MRFYVVIEYNEDYSPGKDEVFSIIDKSLDNLHKSLNRSTINDPCLSYGWSPIWR